MTPDDAPSGLTTYGKRLYWSQLMNASKAKLLALVAAAWPDLTPGQLQHFSEHYSKSDLAVLLTEAQATEWAGGGDQDLDDWGSDAAKEFQGEAVVFGGKPKGATLPALAGQQVSPGPSPQGLLAVVGVLGLAGFLLWRASA